MAQFNDTPQPEPIEPSPMTPFEIWKIVFLPISIIFIILLTVLLQLHAFFALIIVSIIYGLGANLGLSTISIVISGFGTTVGNIGLIITCGTVIGNSLLKSKGTIVLANAVLKLVGMNSVPLAVGYMGYIVSIAVFADSTFIILYPLTEAMFLQSGQSPAAALSSLCAGLAASHTMVPPTPGPLIAAFLLGADLGLVIGLGFVISLVGFQITLLYSLLLGRFYDIKNFGKYLKEGETNEERIPQPPTQPQHPEDLLRDYRPRFGLCLVPIILPVLLIVLQSVGNLPSQPYGDSIGYQISQVIGNPSVALLLGAAFSFLLLEKFDRKELSEIGLVGASLKDCASIILITGAGGAFGAVLKSAEIGTLIGNGLAQSKLGVFIPIIVAAGIKTAQGSSTVSMTTTASIIEPLLPALGLTGYLDRAFVAIAIGGGSLIMGHVNDSLFWIVSQYARISIKQTFIAFSITVTILGLSSSILTVIFTYNLIAGGIVSGIVFLSNIGLIIYKRCQSGSDNENEHLLDKLKKSNQKQEIRV